MTNIDIDRTTYHEANNRIWRIDSGTDYGDLWDLDIFEQHAEDYLEEGEPERRENSEFEILEAEFENRGYKLLKNLETDDFHLLFYIEPSQEIDRPEAYIDKVWENEIETILSETAKAKITLRKDLEKRENTYMNRLSTKLGP